MIMDPGHTNVIRCTQCSWLRIWNPDAEYQGWHRDPVARTPCYGQIEHEQVVPEHPAYLLLGVDQNVNSLTDDLRDQLSSIYSARGDQVTDLVERIKRQFDVMPSRDARVIGGCEMLPPFPAERMAH